MNIAQKGRVAWVYDVEGFTVDVRGLAGYDRAHDDARGDEKYHLSLIEMALERGDIGEWTLRSGWWGTNWRRGDQVIFKNEGAYFLIHKHLFVRKKCKDFASAKSLADDLAKNHDFREPNRLDEAYYQA